jgi:hypothetical protein
MTRGVLYGVLCAGLIGIIGLLAAAFVDGAGRQAVWASASLAFVVQMLAFTVARMLPDEQVMIGWGLGAVLRVLVVILYGVFVVKIWHAPVAPALLSLVGFFFVTTVVEPAFLKRS